MAVLREVNRYLRSDEFRLDIVKQYEQFEILAEGALRTAVANLLRQRLAALEGVKQSTR
jgi:BMFP domain-containing protein YqiC